MIVGEDVRISKMAIIKRPHLARIGNHVSIDDYTFFSTALDLGDYIHISPFVSCVGGEEALLRMGNFTTISAGARVICRGDELLGGGLVSPLIPSRYRDNLKGNSVEMGNFSAVGSNAILFSSVWLAEGVVIGAGSVVTKPVTEPWTVWIGSPARKIKNRDREKMIAYAKQMGYS